MARAPGVAAVLTWDYISESILPNMSFILSNLIHYSEHETSEYRQQCETQDRVLEQSMEYKVKVLRSGSTMEGLNLPVIVRIDGSPTMSSNRYVTDEFDEDIMLVVRDMNVGERTPMGNTNCQFYIETNNVHPGYALLVGKTLMHNDISEISSIPKSSVAEIQYELQGPSLTTIVTHNDGPTERTTSFDFVIAYAIPLWPTVAKEWNHRSRASGWPSASVVRAIVCKGCHIVSKGHGDSKSLEWRFSFSLAEVLLADELSAPQKKCYRLFKALRYHCFKSPRGIVSYHLKTVFYWAAEEIPKACWTDQSMGEMLIYLLDKLLHCLVRRTLPSYFISSNNLLDSIPADIINTIKCKIVAIRHDPLKHLLHFDRTTCMPASGGIYRQNVEEIFKPLLEYGRNGDNLSYPLSTAMPVFCQVVGKFAGIQCNEISRLMTFNSTASVLIKKFDSVIDIIICLKQLHQNQYTRLAISELWWAHLPNALPEVHSAEMAESMISEITKDVSIKIALYERIMQRFPNAPNKMSIQAQITSLMLYKT